MYRNIGFALLMWLIVPFRLMADNHDSLQKVLDKAPTDKERVDALNQYSGHVLTLRKLDEAKMYADKALALAEKIKYPAGIAKSHFRLGQALAIEANYNDGLKNMIRAAAIDDSIHNDKELFKDYFGMAAIVDGYGDHQKVFYYGKLAASIAASLKDSIKICQAYFLVSQAYRSTNFDSAVKYDLKLLDFAGKIKFDAYINQAKLALGIDYMHLGRYKESEHYFLQAIDSAVAKKDSASLSLLYCDISDMYVQAKNIPAAEKYLALALPYKKYLDKDNLPDLYELMTEVYKAKGNYKDALEWSEKAFKLRDSVFKENTSKQMAEMTTKYETVKKEEQIQSQKEELKQRDIIIYASAAFALLILVAGILIYLNNRKIRALNKKLEKLNNVKDKLFSIISHDLRSPLTYMDSLLELFSSKALSPEKLEKYSKELSNTLQHTSQLLDNLLQWAASQMEGLAISPKNIDINDIIKENIQLSYSGIDKKNLSLTEVLQPGITVRADVSMARLVVRNLLSNAIKYTRDGGSIGIETMSKGNFVEISMTDNGIGMDAGLLDALMKFPSNESRPGTNNEKGFGLGLKLCKEFVERNGGTLSITSEPGKGSRFSFTLPMA